MKVIIDRFEGDYAVCEKEDRTMLNIERSLLPENAGEGDVLLINNNNITIDEAETAANKSRIEKLMQDIWE